MKISIKREQSQTGLNFAEREIFRPQVKKIMHWMFAAILICGTAAFTACTNEDNPVTPTDNLAEKLIGKWIVADRDGKPALTNDKMVTTFVSDTQAIISMSRTDYSAEAGRWNAYREYAVEIDGNKVALTSKVNNFVKLVEEYAISNISSIEMFCDFTHTTFVNDKPVTIAVENDIRYSKVASDYKEAILGLWECTELTGIETYNDANARLEFFADGTYKYWRKNDAGEWEAVSTREFQNYFVDGTLLATRWKNVGEDELREWWEIASIADGQMVWTALRKNTDGSTAQQGMKWKKVAIK